MAETKTKKSETEAETVDVRAMIDRLVANAEIALQAYMSMTQEQVDAMVHVVYIDELDETDTVDIRLDKVKKYLDGDAIIPEMEWCGDGIVMLTMMIPANVRTAEATGLQVAEKMGLENPEVISKEMMHPSEGTRIEVKGRLTFDIDPDSLVLPPPPHHLADSVLFEEFKYTIGQSQ